MCVCVCVCVCGMCVYVCVVCVCMCMCVCMHVLWLLLYTSGRLRMDRERAWLNGGGVDAPDALESTILKHYLILILLFFKNQRLLFSATS